MKQLTIIILLLISLIINGCQSSSKSENNENAAIEQSIVTAEPKTDQSIERKLIKEGSVEFETTDISSTRKTIFEAINKFNGYVSSDQEFKSPGRKSNTIIIRVPANNFDKLLEDATKGVERFESKDIKVKDVTEEFLDIQARLKTKKELEIRFLELIKQAKNVTEILEIEKQIGELRSEIESIEGRLKYLQSQISLSTLSMTFYENIPNETEFGQKFKNGFKNGWNNLIWFFVMLINIWPFIFVGFGLILGMRLYRKRKK